MALRNSYLFLDFTRLTMSENTNPPIPPLDGQEVNAKEAAEQKYPSDTYSFTNRSYNLFRRPAFVEGANWQAAKDTAALTQANDRVKELELKIAAYEAYINAVEENKINPSVQFIRPL